MHQWKQKPHLCDPPIDCGAIDKAREHTAALTEGLSNRTQAEDDMEVGAHALQEKRVQLQP
eukprot:1162101-Pelagomonas_calceolata.AAC.16